VSERGTPDVVHVVAWADPVHDALGFGPASSYPEEVWLPRLGPSAYLLWRHLCRVLHRHPSGASVALADLAGALGLGGRGGTATVRRTIARLAHFDVVALCADGLAVRRRLPRLTDGQAASLPGRARAAHLALTTGVGKPA